MDCVVCLCLSVGRVVVVQVLYRCIVEAFYFLVLLSLYFKRAPHPCANGWTVSMSERGEGLLLYKSSIVVS